MRYRRKKRKGRNEREGEQVKNKDEAGRRETEKRGEPTEGGYNGRVKMEDG